MHGLSTLVTSSVLPGPIHHPHSHEVIQDPIVKDCRIAGTKLFYDVDGVSPQMIIIVTLIKDVVGPMLFAEPLLFWKDRSAQHPGIDLAYHQLSA